MFQVKNMAMANNHKSDAWIDASDFYFKFLEINFSWGFIDEKFRNIQELKFDIAFFFIFQKPICFQNIWLELKGKMWDGGSYAVVVQARNLESYLVLHGLNFLIPSQFTCVFSMDSSHK